MKWRRAGRLRGIAPTLVLLLAVLVLIAAIWLSIWLAGPRARTLDERVHDVAIQLKCPVCQGESVADSPSQISKQMRQSIREQLQAGKTEPQVIQYFVNSYGEQIVWTPQWQGFTLLAWLMPIALLLGGSTLLFFVLRDWRSVALAAQPTGEDMAIEQELANVDEEHLKRYREELERELAEDDTLFQQKEAG